MVLLPYGITLFSNDFCAICILTSVLLPYEITLFSNIALSLPVNLLVLLPYEITLFSNVAAPSVKKYEFYYLMKLHYSQTADKQRTLL